MVAPGGLYRWNPADRALGNVVKSAPHLERGLPNILAATLVPDVAAFETGFLSTLADCPIGAATAARLSDRETTVGPGTPFEVPILANFHVLLNVGVDLFVLGRAEPGDLCLAENLFTTMLHAGQTHYVTSHNLCR
jgi:hypothetical protein